MMEYLSIFEEFSDHEHYYQKMSIDEVDGRAASIIDMPESEIGILGKILKSKGYGVEVGELLDGCKYMHSAKRYESLHIYKVEDEWYIVSHSKNSRSSYYLCDQMYGLDFLLEEL